MEVKKVEASEMAHEQFVAEHWKPGIPLVFMNMPFIVGIAIV